MSDTLLTITGLITPFSARGLQQTLEPIEQATSLRRTVNGSLVDLSVAAFRKYTSTISCTDQRVPALNGAWPGVQVTVDCITELAYVTSGGSAGRTIVPGSSRVEGTFTFYRPRLTMRITNWQTNVDEYGASVGWTLRLEEV
jgi:hypothetical protein